MGPYGDLTLLTIHTPTETPDIKGKPKVHTTGVTINNQQFQLFSFAGSSAATFKAYKDEAAVNIMGTYFSNFLRIFSNFWKIFIISVYFRDIFGFHFPTSCFD